MPSYVLEHGGRGRRDAVGGEQPVVGLAALLRDEGRIDDVDDVLEEVEDAELGRNALGVAV